MTPVPVTSYATINACGLGNFAFYQALLKQQTGLGELGLLDIPFKTKVAEIRQPLPVIRPELTVYDSRNSRVALAALNHAEDGLREAVKSARSRYGAARVGVVIGTSTSGLYETEAAYAKMLNTGVMPEDFYFLSRHAYQATPRFLQHELALRGPCFAISTACSSSTKAIAAGQRLINNDICDAVLVGGVDTLCLLTLRGFNSLELVAEDFCRPMDRHRKGINIGEGAALLLLEKPNKALQQYPHVLSVGESTDAYHMSTPHPEGQGASLAMQQALQQAGLQSQAIDYLNLHATATLINDHVEAKAVEYVFKNTLPCSATKGITGHTLGAAGAIEAIVALLALKHGFIPGTWGLQQTDADCHCRVDQQTLPGQNLHIVMSNSFGFGGNNASLILSSDYA